MIEPIAIAPCIPWIPESPVAFRIIVAIKSVAIAIPETGLLELPTKPTILEETVAKKNPKITTITVWSDAEQIEKINKAIEKKIDVVKSDYYAYKSVPEAVKYGALTEDEVDGLDKAEKHQGGEQADQSW